jgi:predicted GNAT superfamily acetyltransferase
MIDHEIRSLKKPEEMEAVEELQLLIWQGVPRGIIPGDLLVTFVHNGGLVLGAFEQNQLVGMLIGFPGIVSDENGNRLKHSSHMLGVHPDCRDAGLGFKLKCAQRDFVINQGINLITWTFDPLLSKNAHLNINRLGAVCNTYLRSEYGQMQDGLNAGLDSDRFRVDWWLDSKRVKNRLDGVVRHMHLDELSRKDVEILSANKEQKPMNGLPKLDQANLLVEIPTDFLAMKAADFPLAKSWRFAIREVFEHAFGHGYLVTDLVHEHGQSFYLLEHGTLPS